jgi:hypothetical protein
MKLLRLKMQSRKQQQSAKERRRLEQAAEIRDQLEGRHHSDSTQVLREDRER